MPGQILAIKHRVIDGDVLALPERVLRHDIRMMNLYILTVLEHVFGIALQSVDKDILREHKGISTLVQLDILQSEAVDLPESLVCIVNDNILQHHVFHLTEELRTVDSATLHDQVISVPDSRARAWSEVTIFNQGTVDMPPRVFAIKLAIAAFHVLTLLNA